MVGPRSPERGMGIDVRQEDTVRRPHVLAGPQLPPGVGLDASEAARDRDRQREEGEEEAIEREGAKHSKQRPLI